MDSTTVSEQIATLEQELETLRAARDAGTLSRRDYSVAVLAPRAELAELRHRRRSMEIVQLRATAERAHGVR